MFRKLIVILLLFLVYTPVVYAGFGVSPPYVKSKILRPGMRYEQTISILRSEASKELQVEATINAPEMQSWISFLEGDSIVLPVGALSVPFTVIVDVPESAPIGNYKGNIELFQGANNTQKGAVGITTGAVIDIDLDLTKEIVSDFKVNNVNLPVFNISDGILGKIGIKKPYEIIIKLTNSGNVSISPSKVTIDVYDIAKYKLVVSGTDHRLKKIKPFKTDEISAQFPLDLEPGEYWGNVKIYNDDLVVYSNNIAFSAQELDTKNKEMATLTGIVLVFIFV
jgi:hypothetical protein